MTVLCLFPLSENDVTLYATSASSSVSPSGSQSPSASASPSASKSPSPSAPAYAPFNSHPTLATNLISYWPCDEASGRTRYDRQDISSYDLLDINGTAATRKPVLLSATGGPPLAPASALIQGDANGTSTTPYLAVPNASAMFPGSGAVYEEFTVNMWFKGVVKGSQWQNNVAMLAASTSCLVYVNADGQVGYMALGWYDGAFKSTVVAFTNHGDCASTPRMFTFWYSKKAAVAHVYMDGVQKDTSSSVVDKAFVSLSSGAYADLYVGCRNDFFQNANGYVSNIGFWNKALTLSEIQDLYNNGYGLPY